MHHLKVVINHIFNIAYEKKYLFKSNNQTVPNDEELTKLTCCSSLTDLTDIKKTICKKNNLQKNQKKPQKDKKKKNKFIQSLYICLYLQD